MLMPTVGSIATAVETIFGIRLILGLKTEIIAKLSGYLLLVFALAITFSNGIKGAFDYSVFAASADAFALSTFTEKYLEVDELIS
tara:strand:- start:90 stop:344 length:255 start_codon:yes stop_codon:yes gene_type:complete